MKPQHNCFSRMRLKQDSKEPGMGESKSAGN
jgi:hypothetical protein